VGVALFATTVASANGQATFRETGSVTIGTSLVWVRGTNAGVVQLFVGRGFHDAFARAHEVDAKVLERWIDSVRVLAPKADSDSVAGAEQVRGSALSADVTMMRRVGGPSSGIRLLMNGEDPVAMPEPTAREFLVVLDSAVRAARELSPSAPATPAQVTTVAAVVVAPAPVPAAPAPQQVAPAPAPAPVPSEPAPSAPVAIGGASTTMDAPELVLPAPSAPMMLLASRVEILPLPVVAPAPLPPPAAMAPDSSPPVAAPPAPPAPAAVAPPVVATVAPVIVAPPPAPPPDTAVAPRVEVPADKLIHTPLGPFTIPAALLSDRDKEAQYCYTQLGLKYTPDLKGEITVKLSVNADGTVQDAVVAKRSWQGISAGEGEACVRALAHDWTFAGDSTIVDGAKQLTFSFSPAP
jgi:hypothetical protein